MSGGGHTPAFGKGLRSVESFHVFCKKMALAKANVALGRVAKGCHVALGKATAVRLVLQINIAAR